MPRSLNSSAIPFYPNNFPQQNYYEPPPFMEQCSYDDIKYVDCASNLCNEFNNETDNPETSCCSPSKD